MMGVFILSTGVSRGKNLDLLRTQPEFRKATRNMMLAWVAIEEALESASSPVLRAKLGDAALILGSGLGELEVTKEFLKELGDSGVARPILFQNSLHNSTLGFLTMKMGCHGPSIAVSNRCFTGENCLEVAAMLLEQGICKISVVIGVDARVDDLTPALCQVYSVPVVLSEGAATLILANDEGIRQMGLSPLGVLEGLGFEKRASDFTGQCDFKDYYEANAIEKLVEFVRAGGKAHRLDLKKPDGTRSTIHCRIG